VAGGALAVGLRSGEGAVGWPAPVWRAGAITVLAAGALAAQAQDARLRFDIPAQPLASALRAFASQGGQQLLFDEDRLARLRAPALNGRYTPREALDRLLAGTGMVAMPSGPGFFTLQEAPTPPGPSSETSLAPVTVTATAERSAVSEGTGSYAARAVTIGKTAQTLREIPQSVTVITRQRIEDENLTSLGKTLERSTGVIAPPQNPVGDGGPVVRGFELVNRQADGVPLPPYTYVPADTAIYDRIEILRGAAGLLQGTGDPSGVVNLVRKRPGDAFAASAAASVGSWNSHRAELDVGGPLNAAGTLRGRMAVALEDREGYIDTLKARQVLGYGILEADLSPQTLLTVGMASGRSRSTGHAQYGLPRATDGGDLNLPRSWSSDPPWTRGGQGGRQVFASLEHAFDSGWKARFSYLQEEGVQWTHRTILAGPIEPYTGAGGNLQPRAWDYDRLNRGADLALSGSPIWWGREHHLLLGANWRKERTLSASINPATARLDNFFLFNPAAVPEPVWWSATSSTSAGANTTEESGLYGAARLRLADPLTLVLGGRLSWWKSDNETGRIASGTVTATRNDLSRKFSPYAGLVYDLDDTWSAYASYADILKPQTQRTAAGELIDPIVGATYEAGIKGALKGGALNVSLAAFRIEQKNRAQEDPDNPCFSAPTAGWCYVAAGKVRSQGVEAELSGELAPGWQAMLGYTYNTTRYLEDRNNAGKVFDSRTPRHLLRASTSYRLRGDWSRWTLGANLQAQSDTFYESGGLRATQGGYAVVGLRASYQAGKNLLVALNINNLFDRRYYSNLGYILYGGVYGDPRNATLTLRASF